jgi:anti-sigma factor ChrR (cupin superfamily)
MLINVTFTEPAVVTPDQYRWVSSPQPGVERVMLDRMGAESGRATSIVRYAPGSNFPAHAHPGGEEILVLSGAFRDGRGHYPAGWYLRNPPGSAHQPSSPHGATLLVKLWQMKAIEQTDVRIDTRDPANWRSVMGQAVCPLFDDGVEQVRIVKLLPGDELVRAPVGGAEFLVLEGSLQWNGYRREAGSWLRLPPGRDAAARAGEDGATVYLKTGHLDERVGGAHPC